MYPPTARVPPTVRFPVSTSPAVVRLVVVMELNDPVPEQLMMGAETVPNDPVPVQLTKGAETVPNDPVPVQGMDDAEMAPLTASCEAPTGPKLPVPRMLSWRR